MLSILYKTLEQIEGTQLSYKNENYNEYHKEIRNKIFDIIIDYQTTTKMSGEEILEEMEKSGISKCDSSIYYIYEELKNDLNENN